MNKTVEKVDDLETNVLVEVAQDYAKRVHSEAKHWKLHAPIEAELPASCCFLTDRGAVVELDGNPFAESPMLPDDLFVLTMNVFAIALDASIVVPMTEVWAASQCGFCGAANYAEPFKDRCETCGAAVVSPTDNSYRTEALMTKIIVKGEPGTWLWLSQVERDEDGAVSGFLDEAVAESVPMIGGRMPCLWDLPVNYAKSVVRCVPTIQNMLAIPLTDWARRLGFAAQALPPASVDVLSIDPELWAESVHVRSIRSLACDQRADG